MQVPAAYRTLDAFHHGQAPGFDVPGFENLGRILKQSRQLQENQDLFDLMISAYLKLQRCEEQLGYLKACWDMVATVMYTFSDWCVLSSFRSLILWRR